MLSACPQAVEVTFPTVGEMGGGAEVQPVKPSHSPMAGKLTGSMFSVENNGGLSLKQDRMRAQSTRAK